MSSVPEQLLLKMVPGTKYRILRRDKNLSRFIRVAIAEKLERGGSDVCDPLEATSTFVFPVREDGTFAFPEAAPVSDDVSLVLGALKRPLTERDLAMVLDWPSGRVVRAVKDAGSAVEFIGGGQVRRVHPSE